MTKDRGCIVIKTRKMRFKREQPNDWSSRSEVTMEECQLAQTITLKREGDRDLGELEVLQLNMTSITVRLLIDV